MFVVHIFNPQTKDTVGIVGPFYSTDEAFAWADARYAKTCWLVYSVTKP